MKQLKYIFEDQIIDTEIICPYCGDTTFGKQECCSESSAHFQAVYVLNNGEAVNVDEYIVVPRLPVGASNVQLSN